MWFLHLQRKDSCHHVTPKNHFAKDVMIPWSMGLSEVPPRDSAPGLARSLSHRGKELQLMSHNTNPNRYLLGKG